MASISPEDAAQELLSSCLSGSAWRSDLLDRLMEPGASRTLFGVVVERLADLFEPHLCDVYAEMFAEVIARSVPSLNAGQLVERYGRIRAPRKFDREPTTVRKVFVLSRVTLGADVAITSLILDAVKQIFPQAAIYFAGPQKSWELFAADAALKHQPVAYGRSGSLADRLAVWPELRAALSVPDSIVIDPDSRLTQLGLLPVCPEENYYFFESRSYGGDADTPLVELTKQWVAETFGYGEAKPFIAPVEARGDPAEVTVSFGVGENEAKRVAGGFEVELLRSLTKRESVLIDRGAGGEEGARVDHAVARCGGNLRVWDGSFAGFAAQIARSNLYLGYDSAGGHVAAACGVPMISVFGGFASERMFQRWRPTGRGPIRIVRARGPEETLKEVLENLF